MKITRLSIACILLAMFLLQGCKSVNLGGTGQVGTVTGSGSVSIPVFRADDQSTDSTAD